MSADTLTVLQRVAVHVVARARVAETGRFSLRVLPGGFGTPEFGPRSRRVRVSGSALVVESDAPGEASVSAVAIEGASLAGLASFAGVDLDTDLDVGNDTPEPGDPDGVLRLDAAAAETYHRWWTLSAAALDRVTVGLDGDAAPSMARLWPEHFDVALDVRATPDVGVNLGGSPGDSFIPEPYLYVGPWTEDRPGAGGFWNAPFGAVLRRSELEGPDPVESAAVFFCEGLRRLQAGGR